MSGAATVAARAGPLAGAAGTGRRYLASEIDVHEHDRWPYTGALADRGGGSARDLSPRTVVLAGGGYNPWTVARCRAELWGVLCSEHVPDCLPLEAGVLVRDLECDLVDEEDVRPEWLETLADPLPADMPVRTEGAAPPAAVLA